MHRSGRTMCAAVTAMAGCWSTPTGMAAGMRVHTNSSVRPKDSALLNRLILTSCKMPKSFLTSSLSHSIHVIFATEGLTLYNIHGVDNEVRIIRSRGRQLPEAWDFSFSMEKMFC
ncbi:hypothetical protein GQX74_004424 [Glossina fuscipes]|nr:hypothetical protein GQX74_004424 [Glossina fuscipes]